MSEDINTCGEMSCKTVESSNSPKENSSVRSRLSSLGIVPFGFHAKTSYDAEEDLLQSRSENFKWVFSL